MKRWSKYIGKRLFYMALTLLIIASATFFLMNALPGTPYNNQDRLTAAQLEMLNRKYGFDQPLFQRYINYLKTSSMGTLAFHCSFPISQWRRCCPSAWGQAFNWACRRCFSVR